MAIPDYKTSRPPLLKLSSDGQEHAFREAINALAESFQITADERRELLPSGKQHIFDNRVGWAKTYLSKADLLDITRRAHFQITDKGKEVLATNPAEINNAYLRQHASFREFTNQAKPASKDTEIPIHQGETTPNQIRTVIQAFKDKCLPECFPIAIGKVTRWNASPKPSSWPKTTTTATASSMPCAKS